MPNYCTNRLFITGTDINKFRDMIKKPTKSCGECLNENIISFRHKEIKDFDKYKTDKKI